MQATIDPPARSRQRLILAVILGLAIVLAWFYRAELEPVRLSTHVKELGWQGMVFFALFYAIATILFLPGSLLTLAGGALFGPWLGGTLSLTGATLGAGMAFLIARYLAGEWVAQQGGEMTARLLTGVEEEGWRFVAFVRLVPIFPFNLLNYALGLTRIRFDHYLVTTLICMAPGGLAYAWMGYAGKEAASGGSDVIQAGMWALGLLGVALLIPRWIKRLRQNRMVLLLCGLAGLMNPAGATEGGSDCLSCHRERDKSLVKAWEPSGPHHECRFCHGEAHNGQMATRSRRNEACTGCHQRETKSYAVSKHGVIVMLAADRMDFSQPLLEGNIRAPTCAYCHMHAGNHHTKAQVPSEPCHDCHSPRLVATWFATGDRMLQIGRMKVREANQVMTEIHLKAPNLTQKADAIFQQMTRDHLTNLRLGVGHQSPDDQWWHGHPALDGDLLRIKSLLLDVSSSLRLDEQDALREKSQGSIWIPGAWLARNE